VKRTNRVGLGAAAAVLGLLAAAGCTSNGSDGTVDADGPPDWEALYDDYVEGLSQSFRDVNGQPPPDDAEFVRFIDVHEFGAVIAACIAEQGFDVRETFDGGVSFGDVPTDQALALAEASYRCEVAYPVHPRFTLPLTEEQIRVTYDYLVDELVPCLTEHGFVPEAPPTWETYLSTQSTETAWRPYDAVDAPTPTEWLEINEACPQNPSIADLYDLDE
jgi:hypothetical protein